MKFNPDIHHRRSIRLKGYDYTKEGVYFLTICAQNREQVFRDIRNGVAILNPAGEMIEKWWNELENKFENIELDEHVIMPNHLHGIIVNVGPKRNFPEDLRKMAQWFKTMTTNEYIRNVKQNNWPPFDTRLWQRNYYERIIRNQEELQQTREYIKNNPLQWDFDDENPMNFT